MAGRKKSKAMKKYEREAARGRKLPMETWADVILPENAPTTEWVDTLPEKTEEELIKKKVEEDLKDYPFYHAPQKLTLIAPYCENYLRETTFTLPEVRQDSSLLLTKLLINDVVRSEFMKILFCHHYTASKFAATSQESWQLVKREMTIWDMTSGFFNHCELPKSGPNFDATRPGSVSQTLIVTPVRRPDTEGNHLIPASYVEQFNNVKFMSMAVNNFADNIRNMQLHRVPLLTPDILALLIPKMRELTSLGIYKCQLIHFGDTMRLLDIIQTDRPLGKENQVYLDFYPNYHLGPIDNPTDPYYQGNYGVTWDNWNGNSILATWALVAHIVPQARRQGIDLLSKDAMFRKWLHDSPCWRVDETLEKLFKPETEVAELVALLDCSNPDHFGNVKKFTGFIGNRAHGWEWATQKFHCINCPRGSNLKLGIFFHWPTALMPYRRDDGTYNPTAQYCCLGCQLTQALYAEDDHYKSHKRDLIRLWLTEETEEWNDTDLPKAIRDFDALEISVKAGILEHYRSEFWACEGYDKETQERQRPLTDMERNRMYGCKRRSPLVSAKRMDPKFLTTEQRKWLTPRADRRNVHGGIW